ncbi:MAG: helix-turn-helix transcriptional regulator [Ardenticatenaceae bacterium]|nr:helix-turn-helix transcriptional regulator [Ardenticatenaceae bacterium]
MSFRDQIRKGSTETLLLMLLRDEPMYGYQISQELARRSDGYFETKEGLLYPTLHRMQKEGLINSEWRQPDGSRRRKYYTLTRLGREQLKEQKEEWQLFMTQLQKLLETN